MIFRNATQPEGPLCAFSTTSHLLTVTHNGPKIPLMGSLQVNLLRHREEWRRAKSGSEEAKGRWISRYLEYVICGLEQGSAPELLLIGLAEKLPTFEQLKELLNALVH